MDVQLLYVADCPTWHVADERLRQALDGAPTVEQLVAVLQPHP